MNKEVKKALNKMDEETKQGAVKVLLDSLNVPYIIILSLANGMYAGHHSDKMLLPEYCTMIAGFLISVAKKNGMTPIQMLSSIGETMSEMMQAEERQRTAADSP